MTRNLTNPPETLGHRLSGIETDSIRTASTVLLSPSVPPYKGDSGRDTRTATPIWLAQKIENSRRTARLTTCPRCARPVLIGPDHDRIAATARADANPTTPLLEAVALLNGAHSYDLIRGELHYRQTWHTQKPDHPHPIHLEHTCPTNPDGRLF